MRGLTFLEKRCLQLAMEYDYILSEEEAVCSDDLVQRGLLWMYEEIEEGEEDDEYEYYSECFEITDMGRLALRVCLPEKAIA